MSEPTQVDVDYINEHLEAWQNQNGDLPDDAIQQIGNLALEAPRSPDGLPDIYPILWQLAGGNYSSPYEGEDDEYEEAPIDSGESFDEDDGVAEFEDEFEMGVAALEAQRGRKLTTAERDRLVAAFPEENFEDTVDVVAMADKLDPHGDPRSAARLGRDRATRLQHVAETVHDEAANPSEEPDGPEIAPAHLKYAPDAGSNERRDQRIAAAAEAIEQSNEWRLQHAS